MASLSARAFCVWLSAVAGVSAQPRPAPPPAETLAIPGRPGWTVDAANGCSLWNPNPHPGETVEWSGACPLGPAQGPGSAAWRYVENGRPFVAWELGVMLNGRLEGTGMVLWSNGDRHAGEWRLGLRHGRGTTVEADGTRLEGDWRAGSLNGPGILTRPNGDTYAGLFVQGRAEGEGVLTTGTGIFQGVWRDGCLRRADGAAAGVGRPSEECR